MNSPEPTDLALPGNEPPENAITILVDADACPVKDEIYRVAERHGAHVRVVSNQMFRVPVSARVKRVTVSDAFDAADDWIAEHAGPRTLVVTGDILLADRALKAGATVLAHTGKPFDAGTIGGAPKPSAPPARSWPNCAAGWTGCWGERRWTSDVPQVGSRSRRRRRPKATRTLAVPAGAGPELVRLGRA